ncbi:MAG: heat-inducible transcriptional repressor HrcA [Chloroflexota bacterium]
MLSPRADRVLKSIIDKYITRAQPVPSQSLIGEFELEVSSATIRNEVARLEQDGYVTRPHLSAGSIPSDKGYRYYVASLKEVELPMSEQRLISHLFHQVEDDLEAWLRLSATMLARLLGNMAVVSLPRPPNCRLMMVEMVAIQENLVLMVLILYGGRIREQLVNFESPVSQPELSAIAGKLSQHYGGLTSQQILDKKAELSPAEEPAVSVIARTMQTEDAQAYQEPYLDGLHLMLSQPEFTLSQRVRGLLELIEHRSLLKAIVPPRPAGKTLQVIIGRENLAETFQDYSVVIGCYGLREGAVGNLAVVGPTRMAYAHAIAAVSYLTSVLSELVTELYGKSTSEALGRNETG